MVAFAGAQTRDHAAVETVLEELCARIAVAEPPSQNRTCGLPVYGSHLGCLTAKRCFGQGWRTRGWGSQESAIFVIRSQVVRSFWRRLSKRRHRSMTE